ncbi:DUF4906 domain-containing protein [Parabacteroides sp.]
MALLSLVLIGSGCEEQIDPVKVPSNEGKQVEVSLNIGLANEVDGYALSTKSATPSTEKGAFSYELLPAVTTKDGTSVKPDMLYRLEIVQYDQNGTYKGSYYVDNDNGTTIGSSITLNLTASDDCQLVIVAWGKGNTTTLGTVNLDEAQNVSIPAGTIETIDPTNQESMNKMPYVLHLKHVKVNANSKIQSFDGQDARLLLKRLAARLTLTWTYNVNNYALKQILLQSIPLNYNVVPKPDGNDTYPSLLDQFTTIQLTEDEIKSGSYSRWIPANVRGTNPASNSPTYRIKANAPNGSIYTNFIAGNINEPKKKFDYRIYLGGSDYSDFNIFSNTDYTYNVTIKHTALPTNDRRVTIIDPIPASENNDNFVPTANCFMVAPGGAFYFNPYKYYRDGTTIDNSTLLGWCNYSNSNGTFTTPIQSVKVLWQTKENGDVGDPVLGTVNTSDDHTNIVDLAYCGDLEKACIYCRVAPNTTGGNGVIVAYASTDGTGDALWSWHIWVTDYSPDATGDATVLTANKRKLKFLYNVGSGQLPMMDRNLGAMGGYVDEVPATPLDKSKTNGFHYQWGRKDPFPSSYSNEDITEITDFSGNVPVKGMLNRYQADGITYFPNINGSTATTSLRNAYANPNIRYCIGDGEWCSDSNKGSLWGSTKTVNDPCPAGWKVAAPNNYAAFIGQSYSSPSNNGSTLWSRNIKNANTNTNDGGILAYYEKNGEGKCVYLRYTGYPVQIKFGSIGRRVSLWSNSTNSCFIALRKSNSNEFDNYNISTGWWRQDVHTLRCIQEQK